MNFLIGEIADGTLTSPLGEIPLADLGAADAGQAGGAPVTHTGRVVVGIRPESFEDAATAGERPGHVAVTATVDVLESTGSDVYAHLSINGHGPSAADEPLLRELAEATASEDPEVALATGSALVARVSVLHSLREGQQGRLYVDASRLHLFDPSSGRRISS
jgi:multiple sugar transport system ATP-binding protein